MTLLLKGPNNNLILKVPLRYTCLPVYFDIVSGPLVLFAELY